MDEGLLLLLVGAVLAASIVVALGAARTGLPVLVAFLALGMLLEPMYFSLGRDSQQDEAAYDFEECTVEEATSVILASEPLTEGTDDWSTLEFGEIVFLERDGEGITRTVDRLKV